MRVNIAQVTPPSLTHPPPSSDQNASPSSLFISNKLRHHRSSSFILTSSTFPRLKSTDQNLRKSCSASFDGHDFPNHHHPIEDFTLNQNSHKLNFPSFRRNSTTTSSFRHSDSHVEVLEPSLLGISPEPPDWPARDAVIRDCIALRASSIEIPLSLRIIKMKQRFLKLEEEREIGDLDEHMKDNPINKLCFSTLYIVREVQSQALKSRGMVLDEELDYGVVSKIQREMTSSFIWLFREVFSKTPDLMLQVMVLTSNFATHSLENLQSSIKTQENLKVDENSEQNWAIGELELGKSGIPKNEVLEKMDESEVSLWNSMGEEADQKVNGVHIKDEGIRLVIDHLKDDDKLIEKNTEFVSPVGIEIEGDDYEEYYRTDLLYQMGLFKEPNNTLLLSNYAQFLCLVSRDYDRAEECFKRAIQLDPIDGEVMTQYANFLWVVRKDLWAAEERFLQAMAAEPNNSFHASKYANFLWSTGGEETCYPLDGKC
ncbi:Adenosine monophosphate-protein transferase Fic [Bienertia sinuspersici]